MNAAEVEEEYGSEYETDYEEYESEYEEEEITNEQAPPPPPPPTENAVTTVEEKKGPFWLLWNEPSRYYKALSPYTVAGKIKVYDLVNVALGTTAVVLLSSGGVLPALALVPIAALVHEFFSNPDLSLAYPTAGIIGGATLVGGIPFFPAGRYVGAAAEGSKALATSALSKGKTILGYTGVGTPLAVATLSGFASYMTGLVSGKESLIVAAGALVGSSYYLFKRKKPKKKTDVKKRKTTVEYF